MPEFHSEPYLHMAGLTHKSALIAWGAFYFRVREREDAFKLVHDDDLKNVHPPRKESIGARSAPYGDALVEVFDTDGTLVSAARTSATNHCWVHDLSPDMDYTYRVTVNREVWANGQRRDWVADGEKQGLVPGGEYQNRFRTLPAPTSPLVDSFTFAIIGDFGRGIKKPSSETRRQREIAAALETAVDKHQVRLLLTTGDNIYAQKKFLGIPVGGTGDSDSDWFFSFYQPYRYIINRIPVYPCIGNHDTAETEDQDDREQLFDNFYLGERIAADVAAGRASIGPGLFYQFRCGADVEFLCLDTSKEDIFHKRLFLHPNHAAFLDGVLRRTTGTAGPRWRIPFAHHPPFSAGPQHGNTKEMSAFLPKFKAAGIRAVFCGHEHNFQHSRADGIDYFVTGGAGEIRTQVPDKKDFVRANTVSWSPTCHFLLVSVDAGQMTVRALGELKDGTPTDILRKTPEGHETAGQIVIRA
jgi:tartrate-resistant acid phosphatase type 5